MPRRNKTIEELVVELNQLKTSYQRQNYDINDLKRSFNDVQNAKIFLKRNKHLNCSDPRVLIKTNIIYQYKDYAAKYKKIINLQNKINTLRRAERGRIIQCANCKRQNKSGLHSKYTLTFHTISSASVRKKAQFKHVTVSTGSNETNLTICHECKEYLVEKDSHPKNVWPSFLWHIFIYGKQ